ncbi:hypothetical protein KL938_001067 [Ogataea parapolymorpha]|nr:hypothetical protein KL938_001067 [Ogataea parapolymorpha]
MSFKYEFAKYIKNPGSCPGLLFHDDNALIIKDLYPKSLVHYLVIPIEKTLERPQEAFADDEFRKKMEKYIDKAREMVVSNWPQHYTVPGGEISDYIQVCCHSIPSMANLHIHVMTKDLCSERVKNKKHYNSFATQFAIRWDEFPLAADDPRWKEEYCKTLLKQDLVHGGINYGSSFKRLREELDRKRARIVYGKKRRSSH